MHMSDYTGFTVPELTLKEKENPCEASTGYWMMDVLPSQSWLMVSLNPGWQ